MKKKHAQSAVSPVILQVHCTAVRVCLVNAVHAMKDEVLV